MTQSNPSAPQPLAHSDTATIAPVALEPSVPAAPQLLGPSAHGAEIQSEDVGVVVEQVPRGGLTGGQAPELWAADTQIAQPISPSKAEIIGLSEPEPFIPSNAQHQHRGGSGAGGEKVSSLSAPQPLSYSSSDFGVAADGLSSSAPQLSMQNAEAVGGEALKGWEIARFMFRVNAWVLSVALPCSAMTVAMIFIWREMLLKWDGYLSREIDLGSGTPIDFEDEEEVPQVGLLNYWHLVDSFCFLGMGLWGWLLLRNLIRWDDRTAFHYDIGCGLTVIVLGFIFATQRGLLPGAFEGLKGSPIDLGTCIFLLMYIIITSLAYASCRRAAVCILPFGAVFGMLIVYIVLYITQRNNMDSVTRIFIFVMLLVLRSLVCSLQSKFAANYGSQGEDEDNRVDTSQAHRVQGLLLLLVPLGTRELQSGAPTVLDLMGIQLASFVIEVLGVWLISKRHDIESALQNCRSRGEDVFTARPEVDSPEFHSAVATGSSSINRGSRRQISQHLSVMWLIEWQISDYVSLSFTIAVNLLFKIVNYRNAAGWDPERIWMSGVIMFVSEIVVTNQVMLWMIARYGGQPWFGSLTPLSVEEALAKTEKASGSGLYLLMWIGLSLFYSRFISSEIFNRCIYAHSSNQTVAMTYIASC